MYQKMYCFTVLFILTTFIVTLHAANIAEIATETEKYCAETAKVKPSPKLIIEKVKKAATLIEKQGKAALSQFSGRGSEFLFAGTYIWIHDMKGNMLMHPIKYKMIGRNMTGLKDKTGKRFIVIINKIAAEKGQGWVSYLWPKPGTKKVSSKVSYFQKVRSSEGIDMVLCCGVYDMQDELVQQGYTIN